jgi:hypothetical protein
MDGFPEEDELGDEDSEDEGSEEEF